MGVEVCVPQHAQLGSRRGGRRLLHELCPHILQAPRSSEQVGAAGKDESRMLDTVDSTRGGGLNSNEPSCIPSS